MTAPQQKLTAVEAAGLDAAHNLADAHTHQAPSQQETDLVFSRVGQFMEEARQRRGKALDREAFAAFMRASGQVSAAEDWFVPTYASSVSMEIVANILKQKERSIALVEPTFDCIADILKRNGLVVHPIYLHSDISYRDALLNFLTDNPNVDTIFLVCPNNPTGHVITEDEFREITQYCLDNDLTILLDTSFRTFDARFYFDQYAILKEYNVEFIAIEDTGKIWPTLDIKISFVLSSAAFREDLEEVANDILLNVSPFACVLVREYSKMSMADDFQTVRGLVDRNRRYLRRELATPPSLVRFPYEESRVSVEIIQLPDGIDTEIVADALLARGVAVLSSAAFFWHGTPGDAFLRVALARDSDRFRAAVRKLKSDLVDILGEGSP